MDLEAYLKTDMMQYRFQHNIKILQAALEVAARLEQEVGQLLAILDLAKEYDKVIR